MKKILSVLLLAAMLVSCVMPSLVSAAGDAISLSVTGPAKVSDTDKTVDVAIELSGNSDSGVWGATIAVAYTKGWTIASIANGELWADGEFESNLYPAPAAYAAANIDTDAYDVALIHVEKDSTEEKVTANGKLATVTLNAPAELATGDKLEVKLAYDENDPMTFDEEYQIVDVAFAVEDYSVEVAGAPTVSASSVEGKPGEYVTVDVTLANFPEVKSMAIYDIDYSFDMLELVNDEVEINGEKVATGWTIDGMGAWNTKDAPNEGAYAAAENVDANGVVFTFVFKIVATENCETAVSFSFTANTKPAGEQESEITGFVTVPGIVKVNTVDRGDVNGDGTVDENDAIQLLYYNMGMEEDFPVNQDNDMTGDGIGDENDAIQLLYYAMGMEEDFPLSDARW